MQKNRIIFCIIIYLGIAFKCYSQNLVPNPSFEQFTVPCSSLVPGGGGITSWVNPAINSHSTSYAYSNVCATTPCCGVPVNTYGRGYQWPHSGNGYASFFSIIDDGFNTNFRNYMQAKLLDTLKVNKCYYIEFFISLNNAYVIGSNNIGLLIGDTAIVSNKSLYTPAIPQIIQFGNPVIIDTMNWVKIAGIYTAKGGEKYITIGNFNDDNNTDTIRIASKGSSGAVYYIDDVSVIPLDSMQLKADAGRDTTIVKGDSVWIGSRLCGLTNVVWYDAANNVIDTGAPGLWVKPTSNTFYVIEQNVCGQYSRDTVYVAVVPLPVVIKNYELRIKNGIQNAMENVWETSTEINVSHFNVQRSADGITFYTIGKINAKGASKYSFIDNTNLSGVVYYKLEIVDKNGSKTYSEIKELSIINYQLSITPNPTNGLINIQLPKKGNWQISATDIEGRMLWKQGCNGCEGTIRHILEGSKGLYLIKITNTNTGQQSINKITLQ